METKNLLKPRYLVIADYPNSEQRNQIGFIYDRNDPNYSDWWFKQLPLYPHLFRLLHWWEHRTVEDFTGYVSRMNLNGEKIMFEIAAKNFLDDTYMKWQFGSYNRKDFLPATLAEYTTYNQSK